MLVVTLKWAKIGDLGAKNSTFSSICSECIKMHQNTSKCMQNELCKGFVHEIIKEVVFITFKEANIDEIHLPLCDGTPCLLLSGKIKITVYYKISYFSLNIDRKLT